MTLFCIGPAAKDIIIKQSDRKSKTGGASYYQSFVFEKYYSDYHCIINCADESLLNEFPDSNKINLIKKDKTHFFTNCYPTNNPDYRIQSSNFADIPILKKDLVKILPESIDAIILNPLNAFDFPLKTINYLKTLEVPIFTSVQGFLRRPANKISDNSYSIDLRCPDNFCEIISSFDSLFLDEKEASIIFPDNDYKKYDINEIIITNGSRGSRVISDEEYNISPVINNNIVDSTGCGDTFMAAYVAKKLSSKSILESANFASKIASEKLSFFGPFKPISNF